MTKLQAWVVFLCLALNMLDGADVLVVSYAAPALSKEWAISPQLLGMVFSSGLAGMTLGAMLLAPLADRVGRRRVILAALTGVGGGMVASGFATSVAGLAAIRFGVGTGIGAMLATVTALCSEVAPQRLRALAVLVSVAGYPIGAVVAGFAAVAALPAFGWRGFFILAGGASLVVLVLCWLTLPESQAYVAIRKNARERTTFASTDSQVRPSLKALLTADHRTKTLLCWAAIFTNFMTLYFLTSWIPKLAQNAGLPVSWAIYAGTFFNCGAAVGGFALGWLAIDRSLSRMIAGCFVMAAATMIVFGFFHRPASLLFALLFLVGLFVQGGFSGLYALVARLYPTIMRSTGVGWAFGAGRFGAIFGPLVGGWAIGAGIGVRGSFVLFAGPMAIAAVAVWMLRDDEDFARTAERREEAILLH